MKYFKLAFYILPAFILLFTFIACDQENDICTEEGTPRMKVKFKKAEKLFTADSITIKVLTSQTNTLDLIMNANNVDSVFIPLKINGDGFTDILVKLGSDSDINYSKVQIKYTEKLEYVSPGCGMRKIYNNISGNIIDINQVTGIEINSKEINNENTTALYLIF